MHLPGFSVNIVITVALVAGAIMGMLGGRGRLRPVILSVYVGIVLATTFPTIVQPHITTLNLLQTAWLLLTLPVLLFGIFGAIPNIGKGSLIFNMIFGLLTGALLLSVAFSLMPTRDQSALAGDSIMAYELQIARPWLVGFMPLAALLVGFHWRHRPKKKKH